MEPQPRIHDNSKIVLTVQVYYERTIIKGEQRGYEQQGQGEMTKENKGKWKIIENNNNSLIYNDQKYYRIYKIALILKLILRHLSKCSKDKINYF